jgi:hypothetical protein
MSTGCLFFRVLQRFVTSRNPVPRTASGPGARVRLILLLATAVLILPVGGQAQGEEPRFAVFAGYSYLHTSLLFQSDLPKGWNASVTGYLNRRIGIDADFSGHYYSTSDSTVVLTSTRTYLLMAGPRYAIHAGKFLPWTHALFGAARTSEAGRNVLAPVNGTRTWFAWAAGGGLDTKVHKNIWVRLFQLDYVRVSGNGHFMTTGPTGTSPVFDEGPGGANNLRLSMGVVLGWK